MRDRLILILLLTGCFALATHLQPRQVSREGGSRSGGLFETLLGDSKRMFANQFIAKADAYYLKGKSVSVFEQSARKRAAAGGAGKPVPEPAEDWIARFGQRFDPGMAKSVGGTNEAAEMLPWLRLSVELDPNRTEIYALASHWLGVRLGRVDEAEKFLREGLAANPGSYEILYELGLLYFQQRHDPVRARNVWESAHLRWQQQEGKKEEPDLFGLYQITSHLGRLEETEGNITRAIEWFEIAKPAARNPSAIQEQIDDLREKLNGSSPP